MNKNAIDTLTAYANEHPEDIKLCLEIAGIFRKLERAGDHINNLAEETVFYIDAEVLKHHFYIDAEVLKHHKSMLRDSEEENLENDNKAES